MMMDGRAGADHRISHAIIRNGTIGLNCQSTLKVTECALRIDNTIIENQSGYGLYSMIYPVEAKNFVISNCGVTNFWAFGGDYRFVHGTIADYWNANEHDNHLAVELHNYATDSENDQTVSVPFYLEMDNCIVYGSQKDEFKTYFSPEADSTFLLDHCLVKSEKFNGNMSGFSHCLFNQEPYFADIRYDFHIDSIASSVIGTGNPLFGNEIPYDLDGVSRMSTPDMGAYQYIPK